MAGERKQTRAPSSRKRGAPGAEPRPSARSEPRSELFPDDAQLDLDGDEPADEPVDESADEADEFPELVGDSDAEAEDEDQDEDEGTDDEDGDEDESGFNSSDLDDLDEGMSATRTHPAHHDLPATPEDLRDGDAALARMVARARVKPDERGPALNPIGIDVGQAARLFGDDRNDDGSHRGRVVRSAVTGAEKVEYPPIEPEYDSDSSTEDVENRIGNVPIEWYDDLPHLGYDINGRRVLRPAQGDELDKFLSTVEGDGDAWFSAHDKLSGQDVRLTDEELDIIQRLQRAEGPEDVYEPATDWFTQHERTLPLSARPEPKRRFVPSKWEHKKVMKIVRAIRQGRIVAHAPGKERPAFYNLWSDADTARADHAMHMPAPKQPLPTHVESYNPPEEYLFNEAERAEWEAADPEDRKLSFVPAKYGALRLVPRYDAALQERFQRCLDLYLAPRVRRKRLDVTDPAELLPKLPAPRELRPFPTHTDVVYAHTTRVRTAAADPTGAWLLTGADDGRVRLWDVALGRCVADWDANAGVAAADRSPVYCVAWSPQRAHALAAVASAGRIMLLAPPACGAAHEAAAAFATAAAAAPTEGGAARWARAGDAERAAGVCGRVHLGSDAAPRQVRWHARGDYFATVCPDVGGGGVLIHQVSKHRSQAPFRRTRRTSGAAMAVQCVCFHPSRPQLFVATQRYVRVYDLVQQTLVKTLQPGVRWISAMDVHPSGEHLLVGSYDRRVLWFDLDLGERPYKTLRYHTRAVRAVAFHPRYPLLATAADDGTVHVYHATVYSDLLQNALIVPLKILRGHMVRDALGVLDAVWHPTLPWLLSAGADGDARLWTP